MFGLPHDFDPSFFKGLALFQVCIGQNVVTLSFEPQVSITTEADLRIQLEEGKDELFEDLRGAGAALIALISDEVLEAHAKTDGTLRLTFASGRWVEFYDDSPHYESYQIRNGSVLHVV
jgi:hypothetical protein